MLLAKIIAVLHKDRAIGSATYNHCHVPGGALVSVNDCIDKFITRQISKENKISIATASKREKSLSKCEKSPCAIFTDAINMHCNSTTQPMSTVIKINKMVITELFDNGISSTDETEKLFTVKGITMPWLSDKNVIRITENCKHVKYINGEPLPKGMEAHIVALIRGGLS